VHDFHPSYAPLPAASSIFPSLSYPPPPSLPSFPTRRSSDLSPHIKAHLFYEDSSERLTRPPSTHSSTTQLVAGRPSFLSSYHTRSEEHTSELQSRENLVCRLLLEKKN